MQQQDGFTLRVLRSRVRYYFRIHDFLAAMYDHHIFIQLSIPLGILPTFLNLYEVIKIPMVTPGTDHTTILGDYPRYLAYHPESEYFMEFDIKPDITHSKLLFLEDTGSSLKSAAHPSCLLALLRNNRSQIDTLCKFTLLTNAIEPSILILDQQHILLTNNVVAKLLCKGISNQTLTCHETSRVPLH